MYKDGSLKLAKLSADAGQSETDLSWHARVSVERPSHSQHSLELDNWVETVRSEYW